MNDVGPGKNDDDFTTCVPRSKMVNLHFLAIHVYADAVVTGDYHARAC